MTRGKLTPGDQAIRTPYRITPLAEVGAKWPRSAHEAACGLTTAELVSRVRYGMPIVRYMYLTHEDSVSVRRALNALARRGLVIRVGTRIGPRDRHCRWHIGLPASYRARAD